MTDETKYIIDMVIELTNRGVSYGEISSKLTLSPSYVSAWVRGTPPVKRLSPAYIPELEEMLRDTTQTVDTTWIYSHDPTRQWQGLNGVE